MRPEPYTRQEYVAAFRELVSRIEASLADVTPTALPIRMYVAGGAARLLYFDRQYNDTLGLMHEAAYDDSQPLTLDGIDSRVLDVRILTPLDLAVSKLGRFSEQDRSDIAALARRGLVSASRIQARALEALRGYVGDTSRLQGNIASAAKIVAASSPAR